MAAYIGERSRMLIDVQTKEAYGTTAPELKAEVQQTAATLAKTIVYMYSELKLPLEKIVEAMGVEADYVKKILIKQIINATRTTTIFRSAKLIL